MPKYTYDAYINIEWACPTSSDTSKNPDTGFHETVCECPWLIEVI